MKLRLLFLTCLGLALGAGISAHAADAPSKLAGTWSLDIARSTPVRPWDQESVTIVVTGDTVVITRNLAWGLDRKASDTTTVKTDGKTVTANPVGYWLDTWYTNVYVGGDHQKHVTGEWLDGGRVLKFETNLFIEAQQGDHAVHIYDEFRLSADGKTLKLYELRSTRDEALVYYFTRA
jgi:hypothetical protein